jgi:hypothetical protein
MLWQTYCDSKCWKAVSKASPNSAEPLVYRCKTSPAMPARSLSPLSGGLRNINGRRATQKHTKPCGIAIAEHHIPRARRRFAHGPPLCEQFLVHGAKATSIFCHNPNTLCDCIKLTSQHKAAPYQAFASASPVLVQRSISKTDMLAQEKKPTCLSDGMSAAVFS